MIDAYPILLLCLLSFAVVVIVRKRNDGKSMLDKRHRRWEGNQNGLLSILANIWRINIHTERFSLRLILCYNKRSKRRLITALITMVVCVYDYQRIPRQSDNNQRLLIGQSNRKEEHTMSSNFVVDKDYLANLKSEVPTIMHSNKESINDVVIDIVSIGSDKRIDYVSSFPLLCMYLIY